MQATKRTCLTCSSKKNKHNVSKWMKEEGIYTMLPRALTCEDKYNAHKNTLKEESPPIKDTQLEVELKIEEGDRWVFYWASEPMDTKDLSHVKDAKDAYNGYGNENNRGLIKTDEKGNAKLILNCPEVYRDEGNLYPRHVHYSVLDSDNNWSETIGTLEVICKFPYEVMKHIVESKNKVIINALPPEEFEKRHIPNSVNLYYKELEDKTRAQRYRIIKSLIKRSLKKPVMYPPIKEFLDDKENRTSDVPIIVYCMNEDCPSAEKLVDLIYGSGFMNVIMYPGGTDEWFDKDKSEEKSLSKEVLFDDAAEKEDDEEADDEEADDEEAGGEEKDEEAADEEADDEEAGGEEKDEEKKEDDVIYYFSRSKHTKWLSTFNKAKSFEYKGMKYPTVEHAFHAQKLDPKDEKLEEYQKLFIDEDLEPNEAKTLGGKKYFKENNYKIRDDWNDKRLDIMRECTEAYYKANDDMTKRLVETVDKKLIHKGFRIDGFWGVNKKENNNHHGKILMSLRDKFSKMNDKEEVEKKEKEDDEEEDEDDKEILIYDGLKYIHYFEDDVVMDDNEEEDVGTWDGENIVWKDDKTYKNHLKNMRKMKKNEDDEDKDDEDKDDEDKDDKDNDDEDKDDEDKDDEDKDDEDNDDEDKDDEDNDDEDKDDEDKDDEDNDDDDSVSEIGLGDELSFSSESEDESEEEEEEEEDEEDDDSNVQALKSLIKKVNKKMGGYRKELNGGSSIKYETNNYCGGWGLQFVR